VSNVHFTHCCIMAYDEHSLRCHLVSAAAVQVAHMTRGLLLASPR